MRNEFDAIVVGMGPVGACMALALAQDGTTVAVVEPSLEPFDKPRAIGIDHDSLRLFQRLGLMDEIAPTLGEYRPSEYRSARGELLRRIIPQPEPHPQSWPPYSTFVQPELEEILRRACEKNPRIDVWLGWSAGTPTQCTDFVKAPIVHEKSGETREVTAKYLIGCDGARSPVRASLHLPLSDLEFDEQWLVVDAIVDSDVSLPDVTVQYCNAQRPATFISGPGSLRRWEIMLLPGEDGAAMAEPESVWRLLAPWLRPDQGRLWRAAAYRFHALVADRWQDGRIFLAGDAVHQTPPFMAQGLNQGIKDVANLAWKINAVVAGSAGPAILRSYTEERQPNAAAVIELTKQLGRIICELDPERAAARDNAMLEAMSAGRGELVRQDLLPPICEGQLVLGGPRFGAGAGKTFPQPLLRKDAALRRLDDILTRDFTLFLGAPATRALSLRARDEGIEIVQLNEEIVQVGWRVDPIALDWLRNHDAVAALVRPDHVVFGTAASESDATQLVDLMSAALDRSNPIARNFL